MKTNPPGTVLVSEAAVKEVVDAVWELERTNHKSAALFYLLQEQFRHEGRDGTMAVALKDRLSCGVTSLCNDMVKELDARFEAAHQARCGLKAIEPVKEGGR